MTQSNSTILPRTGRVISGDNAAKHKLAPLFSPARLLSRERHEATELHQSTVAQTTLQLEQTDQQAREILENARQAAAMETQRAIETGKKNAAGEFAAIMQQFNLQMIAYRDSAELDLQQLALRFARALVDAELTLNPERIAYLVRSALVTARFLDQAVVRLHPEDARLVHPQMELLTASVSGKTRLSVVADSALARHSVRVETSRGDVTSSLDNFFQRLAEALASNQLPSEVLESPAAPAPVVDAVKPEPAPMIWEEDVTSGWAGLPAASDDVDGSNPS